MNAIWQEFLSAAGARIDAPAGLVADFGDAAGELAAARDATVVVPLTHLSLLDCAGEDATTFLHNQLTNDINHLAADQAVHAAWCTAKGRMLASFLVFRAAGAYRLLLAGDLLTATQKRLQMYVLRSKVKLTDLSTDYVLLGIAGTSAEAALQAAALPRPEQPLASAAVGETTVLRLEATASGPRYIVACRAAAAPDLWRALTGMARAAGTSAWQWLDIRAGIPLITEATKEAFVPQMANFDKIGGVSFRKGCYPGQEIVARAHYLGKVKRHLYRLHIDAAGTLEAGMAILENGDPEAACGTIANVAPAPDGGYDALAVIQESAVETGTLTLAASDGPTFAIEALTY